MSQVNGPDSRRRRRSDAERSRTAVLDAATRLLGERPNASLGDIAEAAGVTRQTVYAHYASRDALITAVASHVTGRLLAAMDAVEPDRGPAVPALLRLLDAAWTAAGWYPAMPEDTVPTPPESHELHRPITERFMRVVQRGQESGEIDRRWQPRWLATVVIGLAHTAGEEAEAGRMGSDDAVAALHDAVRRLLAPSPLT
ncbi:TetR family transcriptional regulator [Murinocardiopsis flavida]|uniref:TetR family transcriptional regulator n=1 Tax=Murinocardiopsis flavida TaxID=645275 RepID=A0A2P8CQV6_9ACTN|nr:TetR/AcrR family transcriptional regulator [Murinocardiopsis flavida]PSK87349.1 TetR family transcriptional regulator [Murinocardiopsis flavida]